MKDKTLYWILGLMAAYFVVRFIMNRTAKNNQTAKNTTTPDAYTDEKGLYHYRGHVEGEEAGVCRECGSKTYYGRSFNAHGPAYEDILRPMCSNPNCKSHLLLY